MIMAMCIMLPELLGAFRAVSVCQIDHLFPFAHTGLHIVNLVLHHQVHTPHRAARRAPRVSGSSGHVLKCYGITVRAAIRHSLAHSHMIVWSRRVPDTHVIIFEFIEFPCLDHHGNSLQYSRRQGMWP